MKNYVVENLRQYLLLKIYIFYYHPPYVCLLIIQFAAGIFRKIPTAIVKVSPRMDFTMSADITAQTQFLAVSLNYRFTLIH